jgi:hypothetical protein
VAVVQTGEGMVYLLLEVDGVGVTVTGLEYVHGQSVIVRVVGRVTVYVLVPCVKVVGDGHTVV